MWFDIPEYRAEMLSDGGTQQAEKTGCNLTSDNSGNCDNGRDRK